jgi:phosphate transport system substrate-binding protein
MAVLAFGGADVIAFVSAHPGAIGYVSAGLVSSQVKVVGVEGDRPTPARIADGTYPLSQPFYLIAPKEPDGAAKRFVDFCLGAQGQSIVARQYLPVRAK